jgi:hypothetical protein
LWKWSWHASFGNAMKMVGHKTERVYRRYAIVDEGMMREGRARLQSLHDLQSATG